MTDDLSSVEDRLGKALGELASTTSTSPEGWDRIEERVAGRRRRVPPAVWAAVPVAAVAVVVAVLVAALPAEDSRSGVVAGPAALPQEPSARFAPQGLSAYTLEAAGTTGGVAPVADASPLRVYGRRAADGVRLDAAILVVTARSEHDADLLRSDEIGDHPPSPLCTAAWPIGCFGAPTGELTAGGRQVAVLAIEGGFKIVWDEPDGPTVGLLAQGLTKDALPGVVEGIRLDGGTAVAATLPDGFVEVHRGIWPALPKTLATYVAEQWWRTGNPDHRFALMTYEGGDVSLDTRAWLFADPATLGRVHGAPALLANESGMQSITWQPRPGVLLVILAMGRSGADLAGLAETVRELNDAEWRALLPRSVPPPAPALSGVGSPSPSTGRLIAESDMPGGHWTARLFARSAQRQAVCITTSVLLSVAQSCADIEPPVSAVGPPQLVSFEPAQGGRFVVVPVGRAVSALRFTQQDGSIATLPPMLRTGSTFEVVVVPLGSAAAPDLLVALDMDGREMDRQSVPAPPAAVPPPGAAPAPVPPPPAPPGG